MRELSIGSLWLNLSTHIQVLNFGLGAHIFLHQSQDLSVLRYYTGQVVCVFAEVSVWACI